MTGGRSECIMVRTELRHRYGRIVPYIMVAVWTCIRPHNEYLVIILRSRLPKVSGQRTYNVDAHMAMESRKAPPL
jgi:hypothetical protein